MDIATAMKIRTPFQLYELNKVRLNLKVIFLSDIFYEASSVVKTWYITVNLDLIASSFYAWPVESQSQKVKKKLIKFIRSLTNGYRSLTTHLDSNQLLSFHLQSISSTSEDKTHLCIKVIPYKWFYLYPASRGYFWSLYRLLFEMTFSLSTLSSCKVASLILSLYLSLYISMIMRYPWMSK